MFLLSLSNSVVPPGDFALLNSFRDFIVVELAKNDESSSPEETVVAAVVVEFDRWLNFTDPSPVDVDCVNTEDLLVLDFVLLCPLIDPPKKSPIADPGRLLNRFREIASSPKIAARDRMLAVGVEGAEMCPVVNFNNPYWFTRRCELFALFRYTDDLQVGTHWSGGSVQPPESIV